MRATVPRSAVALYTNGRHEDEVVMLMRMSPRGALQPDSGQVRIASARRRRLRSPNPAGPRHGATRRLDADLFGEAEHLPGPGSATVPYRYTVLQCASLYASFATTAGPWCGAT